VPQLVQLFFWFNLAALYRNIVVGIPFGPELFAWDTNEIITPWSAAILGFGLSQAAYTGEVVPAGLKAVPEGQRRAAKALGMPPTLSFFRIVLPQAMRVIIPPVGNELISMVKSTAIVSHDRAYRPALLGAADLRTQLPDNSVAHRGDALVPRHRLTALDWTVLH
jgi:polar amino acid transport system permease protein